MITVDTSALLAILQNEPAGQRCLSALREADARAISAGTLQEFLIVAHLRGGAQLGERLLQSSRLTVHDVSEDLARRAVAAYETFGNGVHPARLNLGDCFAYALAAKLACPLLYVGNDFAQTDIESALA